MTHSTFTPQSSATCSSPADVHRLIARRFPTTRLLLLTSLSLSCGCSEVMEWAGSHWRTQHEEAPRKAEMFDHPFETLTTPDEPAPSATEPARDEGISAPTTEPPESDFGVATSSEYSHRSLEDLLRQLGSEIRDGGNTSELLLEISDRTCQSGFGATLRNDVLEVCRDPQRCVAHSGGLLILEWAQMEPVSEGDPKFQVGQDILFLMVMEACDDPGLVQWSGLENGLPIVRRVFQPADQRIQIVDRLADFGPRAIPGLFRILCIDDYHNNYRMAGDELLVIGESADVQKERVQSAVLRHLRTFANSQQGIDELAQLFGNEQAWLESILDQLTRSGTAAILAGAPGNDPSVQLYEWQAAALGRETVRTRLLFPSEMARLLPELDAEARRAAQGQPAQLNLAAIVANDSGEVSPTVTYAIENTEWNGRNPRYGAVPPGRRSECERLLLDLADELGTRGDAIHCGAEHSRLPEIRDHYQKTCVDVWQESSISPLPEPPEHLVQ